MPAAAQANAAIAHEILSKLLFICSDQNRWPIRRPEKRPAGANLTPRAAAGSGRIKEKCSIGAAEHLEAGDVNEAILGFSIFLVQDREPDRVLAGLEASVRPIKGQVAPRAELVHHVDRLVVDRH